MTVRQKLARIPVLRRSVLNALRIFPRDVTIKNAWTGNKLRLNLYHHKGYWFSGRDRERNTMLRFAKLIKTGDTVIEAGGHIGYITQYFSKLVGETGKVVVFEPGANNAVYIEQNVRGLPNTTLERMAVSLENGKATFYEDNIGGQNNSLLANYNTADYTATSDGVALVRDPHEVDVVTIDSYVADHGLEPAFLKIDVEGCEFEVLSGAKNTLRNVRALMVEITENPEQVYRLLRDAGLNSFEDDGLQHFATRT